jgi:hypothetical protein
VVDFVLFCLQLQCGFAVAVLLSPAITDPTTFFAGLCFAFRFLQPYVLLIGFFLRCPVDTGNSVVSRAQ